MKVLEQLGFWGQAPKPPGSASPSLGYRTAFCEPDPTLTLLSGKEGIQTNSSSYFSLPFFWYKFGFLCHHSLISVGVA
jgi:hypothetical protein